MTPDLIKWRLDRQDEVLARIERRLATTHDDVLTLKLRARMWGAVAGAITSILVALVSAWFGLHKGPNP